jgi:hypothetical protein
MNETTTVLSLERYKAVLQTIQVMLRLSAIAVNVGMAIWNFAADGPMHPVSFLTVLQLNCILIGSYYMLDSFVNALNGVVGEGNGERTAQISLIFGVFLMAFTMAQIIAGRM